MPRTIAGNAATVADRSPPPSWRMTIEPGRTAAEHSLRDRLRRAPRAPVGRVDRPEDDPLAERRGRAHEPRGGAAAGGPEQRGPRRASQDLPPRRSHRVAAAAAARQRAVPRGGCSCGSRPSSKVRTRAARARDRSQPGSRSRRTWREHAASSASRGRVVCTGARSVVEGERDRPLRRCCTAGTEPRRDELVRERTAARTCVPGVRLDRELRIARHAAGQPDDAPDERLDPIGASDHRDPIAVSQRRSPGNDVAVDESLAGTTPAFSTLPFTSRRLPVRGRSPSRATAPASVVPAATPTGRLSTTTANDEDC